MGAIKQSAAVTMEDENLLWEASIIPFESPQTLQNIFYYDGLLFCFCGVQEQHDLTVQQLIRHPSDHDSYDDITYHQYIELISKNNQHRFKDIHMKNKTTKVYAMVGSTKCMVKKHSTTGPRGAICDLASENRPYDIFNPNGVISIML